MGARYSDEEPLEQARKLRELSPLTGFDQGRMHLGGPKMRSEADTRVWMQQRFDMGIRFANASYAGIYEVHDYWNRRPGDFRHLLQLQTIAAEIGIALGQYMFVACNTYPHLTALLDHLEALPKPAVERSLIPFGYIGWARNYEHERISERHGDELPEALRRLIPERAAWNSEREWIATTITDDAVQDVMAPLFVDEANIDDLERRSCGEIFDDLEKRIHAAYRATPSWEELRDTNGDRDNLRIYANRSELERKWLDLHLAKTPIAFERGLTHLMERF